MAKNLSCKSATKKEPCSGESRVQPINIKKENLSI